MFICVWKCFRRFFWKKERVLMHIWKAVFHWIVLNTAKTILKSKRNPLLTWFCKLSNWRLTTSDQVRIELSCYGLKTYIQSQLIKHEAISYILFTLRVIRLVRYNNKCINIFSNSNASIKKLVATWAKWIDCFVFYLWWNLYSLCVFSFSYLELFLTALCVCKFLYLKQNISRNEKINWC